MSHQTESTGKISLKEFEIYLATAEKVTDRRLSILQSNSSQCLLMIAGLGVMIAWGSTNEENENIALLAISIVSALGAIYSKWFLDQIVSYKQLNGAKFDVLNVMAKNIEIENIRKCGDTYFDPFELEWEKLKARKAATEKGLKSSLSELVVPRGFLTLFILTSIGSLMIVASNYIGLDIL
jgi:hypothetical protein